MTASRQIIGDAFEIMKVTVNLSELPLFALWFVAAALSHQASHKQQQIIINIICKIFVIRTSWYAIKMQLRLSGL